MTPLRNRSRKAIHIALHLRHELGRGAAAFVGALAEEARRGSELEAAHLWDDVAHQLAALDCHDGPERQTEPPLESVWSLMQRTEYYRHRAAEVERKAAAAAAPSRGAMLELAEEWRDLALLADLQARLNRQRAKLEADEPGRDPGVTPARRRVI
jgi:hypothetical protein